ncbi:MAG: VanZ family protein [Deltaproteobacteria bacterium]|nr:VanZ family protein [Deltaproteobacteria bacterium]
MRFRWWRLLPAILWAGALFFQSSQTTLPSSFFLFKGSDKVLHVIAYAILAVFVYIGLPKFCSYPTIIAFSFSAIYAISDEIHQAFVPGRTCDIYDWLADIIGALIGIAFFIKLKRMTKNKIQNTK